MSERSSQPPHIEQPPASAAVVGEPQLAVQTDESLDLMHNPGLELVWRAASGATRCGVPPPPARMGSLVVLLFLGLVAIFPDCFAPYAFDEPDFLSITLPPTTEGNHFLGTDFLGRDTLSRIIYGLRTSLWVALVVSLLATVIGTTIGAVAGFGGKAAITC